MASDEGWGLPASYREGFELLACHGVIDPRIATALTGSAPQPPRPRLRIGGRGLPVARAPREGRRARRARERDCPLRAGRLVVGGSRAHARGRGGPLPPSEPEERSQRATIGAPPVAERAPARVGAAVLFSRLAALGRRRVAGEAPGPSGIVPGHAVLHVRQCALEWDERQESGAIARAMERDGTGTPGAGGGAIFIGFGCYAASLPVPPLLSSSRSNASRTSASAARIHRRVAGICTACGAGTAAASSEANIHWTHARRVIAAPPLCIFRLREKGRRCRDDSLGARRRASRAANHGGRSAGAIHHCFGFSIR